MQCINLSNESYNPEELDDDKIYVMMIPGDISFLYRVSEDGNKFSTKSVLSNLKSKENYAFCKVGSVQIKSGGVPEVLFDKSLTNNDSKLSEISKELIHRNIIPRCTPAYGVYENTIVELGTVSSLSENKKLSIAI